MSQAHLQAFLADIRSINPGINISDRFGTRTSLSGLIAHLEATVNAPVSMTLFDARRLTGNPLDARLNKYVPALQRLVTVWGRGAHRTYAPARGFVFAADSLADRARQNFNLHVQNAPLALRPNYADIESYDDDPWYYGTRQGPGYLHRVVVPGQAPLDITARGLLLKAGLTPPTPIASDNGYVVKLGLTAADLNGMRNQSILDVGCGAAIFRAEMEELYACTTTGIDLNHNHIGAAILNGQTRYVKSTLYLKMMLDKGVLARTSVPAWSQGILADQIAHLQNILTLYGNNLPVNGDVFNLAAARAAHRPGGWDYTVCMFLLCYFTAGEQTNAVLNMCAVTNGAVLLHSGAGSVRSPRLVYDQAQVKAAHTNCNIVVFDETTHHIVLA